VEFEGICMVRNLLNELLWHPKKSLEKAKITYIHRGAPGDRLTVGGKDIKRLERSFFIIERGGKETWIPYHRITEVRVGDETVFRKKS
jgi:uncharacterized protein (UPF0248 family)